MKYYIGFPISFHCNLRCPYCFNKEFYNFVDNGIGTNKWHKKRPFTFEDYKKWRDKHLKNATEIIMHLFGGEPFCLENTEDVFSILEFVDKEKIDILSNGIYESSIIQKLLKYKHKIHRIGFTYHRYCLKEKENLEKKFEENVLTAKQIGIPVYVKELLIKDYREEIINNKRKWLSKGVCFKIQDFKGFDRGLSQEEYPKYSPIDHLLVDPEYKHGKECSCLFGYKNLFIRGFDMADVWPKGGDIIACWYDPVVVGNILEDWYNPNYVITRKQNGDMEVKFVQKIYRGTYERDLPIKNN